MFWKKAIAVGTVEESVVGHDSSKKGCENSTIEKSRYILLSDGVSGVKLFFHFFYLPTGATLIPAIWRAVLSYDNFFWHAFCKGYFGVFSELCQEVLAWYLQGAF